jgi:polysaccharide biosynthesis protein PslH
MAMRSLMIAPAMPALTGNGLAMRLGVFLEALKRVGEVDLAVLPVAGSADAPPTLPQALGAEVRIFPMQDRVDTHFALVARVRDPAERLRAFQQYGRSSLAARLSRAVVAEFAAAYSGRSYDLIHVGRAYMAEAGLAFAGGARLSLDIDENDAAVWRSFAARRRRTGDFAAAAMLEVDSEALEREMASALPRFDLLFASSAAEASSLSRLAPSRSITVAPNAASARSFPFHRDHGEAVVFVGGLGYWPNADGLAWLLSRVWPEVASRRPQAALWLVGAGMTPDIRRLARQPGVRTFGAVPDLAPIYRRAALAVAPLRCGGGTRIKIIEAALAGVATVATPFAAAGLPLRDGCDAWLANSDRDFAQAIVAALGDPAERRRRAASARRRLAGRHERGRAVARLACQLSASTLTNARN